MTEINRSHILAVLVLAAVVALAVIAWVTW